MMNRVTIARIRVFLDGILEGRQGMMVVAVVVVGW